MRLVNTPLRRSLPSLTPRRSLRIPLTTSFPTFPLSHSPLPPPSPPSPSSHPPPFSPHPSQPPPSHPSRCQITSYNGGAVVAMKGDKCVAIACDRRFGVQLQTLATDFNRVFQMHPRLFLGLAGLGTDVQTLKQRLEFRHKLFALREDRVMPPATFAHLVSSILYERRFGPYFIEPVIAGLEDDGTPFVCATDLIGAYEECPEFGVAGTADESLFGACESYWQPGLQPEELFETISQALLAAVDRDALSGWGATVHVITLDKVITRTLKGRMD
ncbi:unnamed protein product [Closterium sp. NIES-53]